MTESNSSPTHSPPPPNAKRPKGILKNSFQRSPPVSPTSGAASNNPPVADAIHPTQHNTTTSPPPHPDLTDKEVTIENTKINAGHRRSSSTAGRPGGTSRRTSSRTPSVAGGDANPEDQDPRIKWDEANLYLTEQERTSTMKITEPKTPYAKHYDPAEDPSDNEDVVMGEASSSGAGKKKAGGGGKGHNEEDIPGLSLGEPEEEVPEIHPDTIAVDELEMGGKKRKHRGSGSRVHVVDDEEDAATAGMTPEEKEKHRKFEEMRKKHYEMKDVSQLLGHPEDLDEEDDDEEDGSGPGNGSAIPPVPPLPAA